MLSMRFEVVDSRNLQNSRDMCNRIDYICFACRARFDSVDLQKCLNYGVWFIHHHARFSKATITPYFTPQGKSVSEHLGSRALYPSALDGPTTRNPLIDYICSLIPSLIDQCFALAPNFYVLHGFLLLTFSDSSNFDWPMFCFSSNLLCFTRVWLIDYAFSLVPILIDHVLL